VYRTSQRWTSLPDGGTAVNDLLLLVNSLALVLLAWLCFRVKHLNDTTRSNLAEVRTIIAMWDLAVQTMEEHNQRIKSSPSALPPPRQ
jgi:hypothetical protein